MPLKCVICAISSSLGQSSSSRASHDLCAELVCRSCGHGLVRARFGDCSVDAVANLILVLVGSVACSPTSNSTRGSSSCSTNT